MAKRRYDYENRWPLGRMWMPDEVAVADGVTIVSHEEGRWFSIRFAPGCARSAEEVVAIAEARAREQDKDDTADDELCALFLIDEFTDWALDAIDDHRPIKMEETQA